MIKIRLDNQQSAFIHGLQNVEVDDPQLLIEKLKVKFDGVFIQLVEGKFIAGPLHVELVVKQTLEAKRRGIMWAKDAGIDFLARIACDPQISRALQNIGVKKGLSNLVLVAVGKSKEAKTVSEIASLLGRNSDEEILPNNNKKEFLIKTHSLKGLEATNMENFQKFLAEKAAITAVRGNQ